MTDGGPAFPYVINPQNFQPGMSLRDFIATQVLGAIVAQHPDILPSDANLEDEVRIAYKYADLALIQRLK